MRADGYWSKALVDYISSWCGKCAIIWLLLAMRARSTQAAYGALAGEWQLTFDDNATQTKYFNIGEEVALDIYISSVDLLGASEFYFTLEFEHRRVIRYERELEVFKQQLQPMQGNASLGEWHGKYLLQGRRLGYTQVYGILVSLSGGDMEYNPQQYKLAVLRNQHLDDQIFAYTAPALVLLMFINLGTVLDLKRLRVILLRPIGPTVAVCARYAMMPALGLGLGMLLFSNDKYLLLGLFYTALSPSGGLANICAVFLKGNINLSIAATTINSLFALGMLPLWIFVLMEIAPADSDLSVPYVDLAIGSIALVLAITLGVLLRVFFPKTTTYIFRFLKPLSMVLSLCLVGLTVGINWFVFTRITGMIILAALLLPSIGFGLTYLLSRLCRLPITDALTIAIETSVLNMTVPIMLLQHSFERPQADLILVVPIISALMSLLLVVVLYAVRRWFGWNKADEHGFDAKKLLDDQEILVK